MLEFLTASQVLALIDVLPALTHVVNFYLDEKPSAQIQAITNKGTVDEKDKAVVQGFVLEALRKFPWAAMVG